MRSKRHSVYGDLTRCLDDSEHPVRALALTNELIAQLNSAKPGETIWVDSRCVLCGRPLGFSPVTPGVLVTVNDHPGDIGIATVQGSEAERVFEVWIQRGQRAGVIPTKRRS